MALTFENKNIKWVGIYRRGKTRRYITNKATSCKAAIKLTQRPQKSVAFVAYLQI